MTELKVLVFDAESGQSRLVLLRMSSRWVSGRLLQMLASIPCAVLQSSSLC